MGYWESKRCEKFWYRAHRCKHQNLSPVYSETIRCGTPYCSGQEVHCLDCGAFITTCGCGFLTGMSGWSESRHHKQRQKRDAQFVDALGGEK